MNDEQENMRAAHEREQHEAAMEQQTRDEYAWENYVATAEADLEMKRAHAHYTEAKAGLLGALAALVIMAGSAGAVWVLAQAAIAIVGWVG